MNRKFECFPGLGKKICLFGLGNIFAIYLQKKNDQVRMFSGLGEKICALGLMNIFAISLEKTTESKQTDFFPSPEKYLNSVVFSREITKIFISPSAQIFSPSPENIRTWSVFFGDRLQKCSQVQTDRFFFPSPGKHSNLVRNCKNIPIKRIVRE